MPSNIKWTDETWNPVVGCSKVSEGCANCYAETMAHRLRCMGVKGYLDVLDNHFNEGGVLAGTTWNGKTVFVESVLEKPLHWRAPRKIFVCSMGDLFHESVEPDWICAVMDIIARCPQHTFQILTKRAERMQSFFRHLRGDEMPRNLWLGVTAENQAMADERLPFLLSIPCAVRFVSCEPMLGPVDLQRIKLPLFPDSLPSDPTYASALFDHDGNTEQLDWVICGCESGPVRRTMSSGWAYSLMAQCDRAGVAFFMKQMEVERKHKTRVSTKLEDFPQELQVRRWPSAE